METINYLLGYKNLRIVQDTDMFRFSLDSVLLPNFIRLKKSDRLILDIGCGNAPIPLILSTKTDAHIIGVEIQKEVCSLAKKTIIENHLESQIEIVEQDINIYAKKWETDSFDVITCNPPFFKVCETSKLNDSNYKVFARHEVTLNLEQIIQISSRLLKHNGTFAMVHRPERMMEILLLMKQYHIEPKRIQFVYPKTESEANILLIEGHKSGRTGLKVLPPIYVHEKNGEYSEQVKQYFREN